MRIYEYVLTHWKEVKENPLSERVKRLIKQYAYALMQRKRFWNPYVADSIAEEVLIAAAVKLFPEWENITAERYAGFLVKATQIKVKDYFKQFAIQKRRAQKAGEIVLKELQKKGYDTGETGLA